MWPALSLQGLVNEPTPERLRDDEDVYRQPNSVMRVSKASFWPNRKPPEHEYDSRKEERHNLHPYM